MNDGNRARAMVDTDSIADDASGTDIMVIRVWKEAVHEHGFRARLTFGTSLTAEPSMVLAADSEQVVEAVRTWLSGLPAALAEDADQTGP